MFVYKIQVNPIHTILKYGEYYDFMDRKAFKATLNDISMIFELYLEKNHIIHVFPGFQQN